MSRIGKKPVPVPSGVTASVDGQTVKIEGPEGRTVASSCPTDSRSRWRTATVKVDPRDETKPARAQWGMSRDHGRRTSSCGVTKGFEKKLEINGVGYKAAVAGKVLKLSLGYCTTSTIAIPEGISIVAPKPTEVVVTGIDKQMVGQVAAEIRDYRGPEPYKGKGVKYAGEFIFRKEGKKK